MVGRTGPFGVAAGAAADGPPQLNGIALGGKRLSTAAEDGPMSSQFTPAQQTALALLVWLVVGWLFSLLGAIVVRRWGARGLWLSWFVSVVAVSLPPAIGLRAGLSRAEYAYALRWVITLPVVGLAGAAWGIHRRHRRDVTTSVPRLALAGLGGLVAALAALLVLPLIATLTGEGR